MRANERAIAMLTLGIIAMTALVGVILLALDDPTGNATAITALVGIGAAAGAALGANIVAPMVGGPPQPPVPLPPPAPPPVDE